MRLASVAAVVQKLNAAGVRYLVAGGLAVNAHGYHRFTKDVDLALALTEENVRAAFSALAELGYRPLVPLSALEFSNAALRERLATEKGMRVLQFWSDEHRETPIDVFVRNPFPFDEEYARATLKELAGAGAVRMVSIPTLIRMKEEAGRPEDETDVRHLRMLWDAHE